MSIQLIFKQAGPLPISHTFSAPGDEPMYLEVNGSAWSQTEDTLLGVVIDLDGSPIGEMQLFSNGSATHRAMVPAYVEVQLDQGQHTLTLSAASGTVSDFNDSYTAVLHY